MAWYNEACFYHIYPLGLLGAPATNDYGEPVARLRELEPWIRHIRSLGCNAIYIGPLFESVAHGYDTTDYRKVDSRLGTNEDLKWFVGRCHEEGIKVILDAVFNHTGRDFPFFKDIQANRENSPYRYWYCDVNFGGNNEYNDGFSYANWGGFNVLVKLNLWNQEVRDYLLDVVRFWVSEFDIDGLRLDVASDLHFDFMHQLRQLANSIKPDFWLMGEVIHGDYSRWVNPETLHSVTNYTMYKGLYSGHNDHNYFEIAHTVRYLAQQVGGDLRTMNPYNFADNHDVDRLASKLSNKAHLIPIYTLIYTLPGVPSIYYGSEFGIEGRKEKGSDAPLRPALNLGDLVGTPLTEHLMKLGASRAKCKALSYGSYEELLLTNRQYAFSRNLPEEQAIVAVNNDDNPSGLKVRAWDGATYTNMLTGATQVAQNGCIHIELGGNSGEIWTTSRTF